MKFCLSLTNLIIGFFQKLQASHFSTDSEHLVAPEITPQPDIIPLNFGAFLLFDRGDYFWNGNGGYSGKMAGTNFFSQLLNRLTSIAVSL